MRNKMFLVLMFAAFAITAGPASIATAHGDEGGMMCEGCGDMQGGMGMHSGGPGMMQGMEGMQMTGTGPGHMMNMKQVYMLDLTPEQRTKITIIQDDLRRQNWPVMGKLIDEKAKLRDLYQADPLDTKKISAVYDTIFGLQKQMIAAGTNATNSVRDVLTKEQRARLKETGGHPCGAEGGMHHGMMKQ